MKEIEAIVKKYDIAAIVVLHNIQSTTINGDGGIHTQGFSEFLFRIDPSYSAATLGPDGKFAVKGKAMHYKSKEERDKKMGATVNMLDHLAQTNGKMAMWAIDMLEGVQTMVKEFDREPGQSSSKQEQDN